MSENCIKCGYSNTSNQKFGLPLCDFCLYFAPDDKIRFDEYIKEKVNSADIETFRKNFHSRGLQQKKGMILKASRGRLMSRSPFGYKIEDGKLVPAENFREVENIFQEFLNTKISLNQLSQKYKFSVNGLKKILKNFTYLGKIKFNNQIHDGNHQPIISSTLFNHVQNKLEQLKIK